MGRTPRASRVEIALLAVHRARSVRHRRGVVQPGQYHRLLRFRTNGKVT